MENRDIGRGLLVCAAAWIAAGCASDAPAVVDEGRPAGPVVIPETIFVQLDGVGTTPADEFRPPEQERYLEEIMAGLRESGAFAGAEIWTPAAPQDAVIVDTHVDASIDAEDSWSKAAWLMVVPIRTVGNVRVTFDLKRGDRLLDRRRYEHEVVTYVVPAAELGGRTWVEKSGMLPRFARRFGDDLEVRALLDDVPVAMAVK